MIMKKLDIHCHLYEELNFPIQDGYYLDVPQTFEMFEKKNVARGVILPEVHYDCCFTGAVQRVEDVAKIAAEHPDRFYFFMNLCSHSFYANPEADYSPLIEYYLGLGALGVGEICENKPFYDPCMDNMLFHVNKYKLPLIFHMTHSEFGDYGIRDDIYLSGLENALRKWKNITFIGHSADFWAEISGDDFHTDYPEGPVVPGGRVVELMRKYPNLHADISAGSGYNALARDREFGVAFMNEFQDRLYFGQDCCSVRDDFKTSFYLDELLESGEISQQVYNKICWENAVKLLKLPLTEKDFMM